MAGNFRGVCPIIGRLRRFCTSASVSYTHLDVYKRQGYNLASDLRAGRSAQAVLSGIAAAPRADSPVPDLSLIHI